MGSARAAIFRGVRGAIDVEEIDVDSPAPGEVAVALRATGVCHSDQSMWTGTIPHEFPAVLGHEGAGIVTAVGEGVDASVVGEHVVLSWLPQCGECFYCGRGQPELCRSDETLMARDGLQPDGTVRRHAKDGMDIRALGAVGTFATHTVVPADSAIPIPKDLPFNEAALLGCAVMSGVGPMLNAVSVTSEDVVAVFGVGGVGLAAVQGARIAGAGAVVAVDIQDDKLELARELGATHQVNPTTQDAAELIRSLTEGRGADISLEVIGRSDTARLAFDSIRPGGTCLLIGIAAAEVTMDLPMLLTVAQERCIRGVRYGAADLQRDVPRLVELISSGQLDVSRMVTRTAALEELPEIVRTMSGAPGIRTVIEL